MIDNRQAAATYGLLGAVLLCAGCSHVATERPERFQGTIEFDEVALGFDLAGRVKQVAVKEGDVLSPGAKIAELDDGLERSAREASAGQAEVARSQVSVAEAGSRPEEIAASAARVRAARAAEDLLRVNLARQRMLLERGAVAGASVDELESALTQATAQRQSLEQNWALLRRGARAVDVKAALVKAEAAERAVRLDDVRLAHHELSAPSAGSVLDVHVEPGEVVAAGTPIVTLANTAHPYADVFVPQAQLGGIRLGSLARAEIDALKQPIAGRVEHIGRRTEFTPRYLFSDRERPNLVVRVRVRFDDPSAQLFAGVPAFVSIDQTH